jgi:hypothetical protein
MTQDIIRVRNGKGDQTRKGFDHKKFRENYDLIFKKKEEPKNDDVKKPE